MAEGIVIILTFPPRDKLLKCLALPEFEVLKAKANFPFNNTTKIQIKFWRFIHPRQSPNIKKVWQSSIFPK